MRVHAVVAIYLTVCASLARGSYHSTRTSTRSFHDRVKTPADYGVHHAEIPGEIHNPSSIAVLAHIYFRVVAHQSDEVELRGFLLLERVVDPITLHPEWGGHITQPDEIAGLPPPVLQVTFAHTPPLNTTCRGHGDRFRPFVFSLVIAKSAWSTATALRIDGWPRFLQLYQPDWMVSGEQQIPPTPTFLLGHFRLSDYYTEEQKTLLMHMHMRWHSALGFQGAVVYEPRPSIYTGHADTAHLIAHNMLTVMRWLYEDHGYAMLRVNAGDYYDQGLVYNHMMLAYYGRNTYLLLTNPDEYLATPSPTTVHTMLDSGCLQPWRAGVAALQCFDAAIVEGEGRTTQIELPLWQRHNLTVLSMYRHVTPTPHLFKTLGFADSAQQMGIHAGLTEGMSKTAWENASQLVPPDCGFLVHFRNAVNRDADLKITAPQEDALHGYVLIVLIISMCFQHRVHRHQGQRSVQDLIERVDWLWPMHVLHA